MVTDKVHEIECPACGVKLPLAVKMTVDENGRSRSFDESFIDEHMAMHAECSCMWMDSKRHHDDDCTVHGNGGVG